MDVILIGTLAAIWLSAGLLVDGLPTAGTAGQLRRRARLLTALVVAGAVVFVALPFIVEAVPGVSAAPAAALFPAVPALIVLTATLRRLSRVRQGAGAFATAPLVPVPPGLRAAAAHPLVTAPLQVTGVAALVGLPIAAGVVSLPGSGVAGVAITVVAVAVAVIGLRAGLRHSRLALLSGLAPLGGGSRPF